MRTICVPAVEGCHAPTCLVLLPPAYGRPEDFLRLGFVDAVRARGRDWDVTLVELEMQHVLDRKILRHLRHRIVLPARAQGAAVWLAGISLGAFMALAYAERYPAEPAGLCLLAPYLGSHLVTGEIERARGLALWQPGALTEEDDERRVWRFIQRMAGPAGAVPAPAVHLGFGAEDRFAAGQRLMAEALAGRPVDVIPGGHDWHTWRKLWENFIDARTV